MNLIEQKLTEVTEAYPDSLTQLIKNNWTRLVWQVEVVVDNVPKGGTVMDLGAGLIPFMAVCQILGYKTIMVDDYADDFYKDKDIEGTLEYLRKLGVQIIEADVFSDDFANEFNGLDMVTSHDSMEHWHNSPKKLFNQLWQKLNVNGLLWLGVPNCVNIRKRITVPFGYGKWSQMLDWYETPIFRGHVREPDVNDLHYIAQDIGADKVKILGRNWIGYRNKRKLIRTITPIFDKVLQLRPSLCTDIYLLAWKSK